MAKMQSTNDLNSGVVAYNEFPFKWSLNGSSAAQCGVSSQCLENILDPKTFGVFGFQSIHSINRSASQSLRMAFKSVSNKKKASLPFGHWSSSSLTLTKLYISWNTALALIMCVSPVSPGAPPKNSGVITSVYSYTNFRKLLRAGKCCNFAMVLSKRSNASSISFCVTPSASHKNTMSTRVFCVQKPGSRLSPTGGHGLFPSQPHSSMSLTKISNSQSAKKGRTMEKQRTAPLVELDAKLELAPF
mmetsp:Transcript_5164/g.14507  ORF Transcript_5164/g.14507 Transcript_5164/m.14507 type:complete len:245 (-) Transcript_5164:160-894(-)